MTTNTYDVGDAQRLAVCFYDFNDALADPDAVTASVTEPDGVVASFSGAQIIKDSVGNYHLDYVFTKKGRHKIKFNGVGTVTSAESADIYIRA